MIEQRRMVLAQQGRGPPAEGAEGGEGEAGASAGENPTIQFSIAMEEVRGEAEVPSATDRLRSAESKAPDDGRDTFGLRDAADEVDSAGRSRGGVDAAVAEAERERVLLPGQLFKVPDPAAIKRKALAKARAKELSRRRKEAAEKRQITRGHFESEAIFLAKQASQPPPAWASRPTAAALIQRSVRSWLAYRERRRRRRAATAIGALYRGRRDRVAVRELRSRVRALEATMSERARRLEIRRVWENELSYLAKTPAAAVQKKRQELADKVR